MKRQNYLAFVFGICAFYSMPSHAQNSEVVFDAWALRVSPTTISLMNFFPTKIAFMCGQGGLGIAVVPAAPATRSLRIRCNDVDEEFVGIVVNDMLIGTRKDDAELSFKTMHLIGEMAKPNSVCGWSLDGGPLNHVNVRGFNEAQKAFRIACIGRGHLF